ncbi:MAG: hypothetical protein EA428_03205 [Spirochaetaceae bacterium]|nr:MAG: hypothetical protein EA428_03205 [Spirochaetaceae bacterium]
MRSVEEVFSGRLPLIAAAFGGVVLLAVLLAVVASLVLGSGRGAEGSGFEYTHALQRRPISVEHMVLPTALPDEAHVPIRFREPQQEWSAEEIEPFLLDSRSLGLEYLRGENAAQLERMLEAIP